MSDPYRCAIYMTCVVHERVRGDVAHLAQSIAHGRSENLEAKNGRLHQHSGRLARAGISIYL